MDLQMPVMGGIEATKKIKEMIKDEELPNIPIVGLSADVRASTIRQCIDAGMISCLSKPFENHELQKILKQLWPNYKKE